MPTSATWHILRAELPDRLRVVLTLPKVPHPIEEGGWALNLEQSRQATPYGACEHDPPVRSGQRRALLSICATSISGCASKERSVCFEAGGQLHLRAPSKDTTHARRVDATAQLLTRLGRSVLWR